MKPHEDKHVVHLLMSQNFSSNIYNCLFGIIMLIKSSYIVKSLENYLMLLLDQLSSDYPTLFVSVLAEVLHLH